MTRPGSRYAFATTGHVRPPAGVRAALAQGARKWAEYAEEKAASIVGNRSGHIHKIVGAHTL